MCDVNTDCKNEGIIVVDWVMDGHAPRNLMACAECAENYERGRVWNHRHEEADDEMAG